MLLYMCTTSKQTFLHLTKRRVDRVCTIPAQGELPPSSPSIYSTHRCILLQHIHQRASSCINEQQVHVQGTRQVDSHHASRRLWILRKRLAVLLAYLCSLARTNSRRLEIALMECISERMSCLTVLTTTSSCANHGRHWRVHTDRQ